MKVSKFCLELATGGGKTYIVYKILSMILPDVIIIFSPRKKINTQNVDKKYLSLLNNQYEIFNCSIDKNFEVFKNKCQQENKKIIIIGCPQSKAKENIYEIIYTYNLNNILIWYDEFHHTIENWIDTLEDNRHNKFYLQDNNKIKYRIFTSASPDKNKVKENTNIFRELHSPIKVKDLISQGWLCPLIPMAYYDNENDLNISNYILENFNLYNKEWGLSFHNCRNNAYYLFYKHYEQYKNKKTIIKPYLLIGDDFKTPDLDLNYNYRNIKNYESNKYSIGYVVQLYNMGYDYNKIDFEIFSDKKLSHKDIIQCIGRTLRPDKLGKNGKNKYKTSVLLLPIFIDNIEKHKYKKIIEVIKYLIFDMGIEIDEIIKPINLNTITNNTYSNELNYEGVNNIKAQIIDLLNISMNTDRLINFCINNNIKNQAQYNEFKKINSYLKLKDNIYEYKGFKWKPIIDPNSIKYYKTKQICNEKKDELLNNLNEEQIEDFENDGYKFLNTLDPKFPPFIDLNYFY